MIPSAIHHGGLSEKERKGELGKAQQYAALSEEA